VLVFERKGGADHLWKIMESEDFFVPQAGVLGKTCLATLLKIMARFPTRNLCSSSFLVAGERHIPSCFPDSSVQFFIRLMSIISKVTSFPAASGNRVVPQF